MARGKYKKRNLDARRKILEVHENGGDWKSVCEVYEVNERTAYDWIRQNQREPRPKGGCKTSRKSPELINALLKWIENDCQITLKQCRELLLQEFQINVCVNTVKNWLDCELISVKAVRPAVQNVNSQENKEKRSQYVSSLMNARSKNRTIIWIDETNFNLFCRRKQGRSKIGCRSTVITPNSKGSNLHCIAAMSSTRLIHFECRRGSFKGEDCKRWFRELINTCADQGINAPTIVCDNAPVHSQLETVIQAGEDVELLRLAPYSYLINPIELAWSSFKSAVKDGLKREMPRILNYTRRDGGPTICEHRMQILEAIALVAKNTLTAEKLMRFANHVERFYPGILRMDNLSE